MDVEVIEKYRKAGKILAEVRTEAVKKVKPGVPLLEVAEFVEALIKERGGVPAFPCNISRNDEAAHSTPSANDATVFDEDMVKLDIGVHVDGYIADTAITVDLSENPELVKASEAALKNAIEIVHAGTSTAEIGDVIEKTINEFDYKPVANLTGHGLDRYVQHAAPSIPNRHVEQGVILKAGDVIAIEPFATNGAGHVHESGTAEIYRVERLKPVRLPAARQLLKEIEKYKMLPFAKRWLHHARLDFTLNKLEAMGILRSYPVLREDSGGLISQAEHTVIVEEGGCQIISR
ncbi:MAG: type II methionyl aminopeptidase [Methanocellales archaeon]|nr:type II methionyl aminopeptidase [Methanocellales archaeon]